MTGKFASKMQPVRHPRDFPAEAVSGFLSELASRAYRLHGLIIWHKGILRYADAAEPYTLQSPHRLFSSAKSILVLAALKAIEQGKLHLSDRVVSFFPEYEAAYSLRDMTFEDLLTMRTGQEDDPFGLLFRDFNADLIRAFLQTPAEEPPGTRFRYNNTVPHMICAVVSRAVGMPFPDYFARYFSDPLDAPVKAPTNPQGIYNPVITTMSMESFFRYALLFLHGGESGSMRLIPEELIRTAQEEHTRTGLEGNSAGYGYQIWRNAFGGSRMDGGWGQFAFLLPDSDTCTVMLSDMTDCSAAFTAFEKHLLPAFRRNVVAGPQPEVQLASLAPVGDCTPDPDISNSTWSFPDGSIFHLKTGSDRITIHIRNPAACTAEIGLHGVFLPARRYFTRPVFSIDQTVYGQDADELLLSGAWSTPRCLDVTAKCLGEMGEYAARLIFGREKLTVFFHDTVQHGIADPMTGKRTEGTRQYLETN